MSPDRSLAGVVSARTETVLSPRRPWTRKAQTNRISELHLREGYFFFARSFGDLPILLPNSTERAAGKQTNHANKTAPKSPAPSMDDMKITMPITHIPLGTAQVGQRQSNDRSIRYMKPPGKMSAATGMTQINIRVPTCTSLHA